MSSDSSVKTIAQVQMEYRQLGEGSVHGGFRSAVDAMLRDGFEGSFSNDRYSDALVLTQKMLCQTAKNLRVLSGSECNTFFSLLLSHLKNAVGRIKHAGGKARFILVEKEGDALADWSTLKDLAAEYPGVVEIVCANANKQVAHFMVADDEIVRVEEKHDKLTPDSPETAIRAKVYFDEAQVAQGYIKLFDKIWTNLM